MAKSSDKKTTIILLVILAISVIGGGIWTYNSLRPTETGEIIPAQPDSLGGLSLNTVYQIKEEAIANIVDFLGAKGSSNNIWNDFYTDRQFNRLNDVNLNIDISGYKNNPNPFVLPTPTEE